MKTAAILMWAPQYPGKTNRTGKYAGRIGCAIRNLIFPFLGGATNWSRCRLLHITFPAWWVSADAAPPMFTDRDSGEYAAWRFRRTGIPLIKEHACNMSVEISGLGQTPPCEGCVPDERIIGRGHPKRVSLATAPGAPLRRWYRNRPKRVRRRLLRIRHARID